MKISTTIKNGEKETFFVLGIDLNNKMFFIYDIDIPCLIWIEDKQFDFSINNDLIMPSYLIEDIDNTNVFLPIGLHKKNLKFVLFDITDKFDFGSWNKETWAMSKYLKIIDSFGISIYESHRVYVDKYSMGLAIQTYLELLIDTLHFEQRVHQHYNLYINHKSNDSITQFENTENWYEILINSIDLLFQHWLSNTDTKFSDKVAQTLKRKLYLLIAAWIVDEGSISIINNLKEYYELNLIIHTGKYSYSIQVEFGLP